ncbi:MAG: hypothetical protein FJ265_22010, partial [Planctomycetes bacterium]|nr:hypothetical protein [Planctomycetota bacterium]
MAIFMRRAGAQAAGFSPAALRKPRPRCYRLGRRAAVPYQGRLALPPKGLPMPQPLAAVFVGSDTLLLQCVEIWRERGHRIAAVVTDADKVRRFCAEQGLRCVDGLGDHAAALAGEPIDVLFAITWLRLLPAAALRLPRRFAINFHDGPLPRYAGLNATCWAILHGETEHAVTWHRIEARADTGDVLVQRSFPIAPDDTAFTLNARCFQAGQETFAELVQQLAAGTLAPRPQDLGRRSYFGRHARPAALAVLDFAAPAAAAARLVRAFDHGGYRNPIAVAKVRAGLGAFAPGAAEPVPGSGAPPGTVTAVDGETVQIACADADVRLSRLRCLHNLPLGPDGLRALGVVAGARLPATAAAAPALTALGAAAAPDEPAYVELLARDEPLAVPGGAPAGPRAEPARLAVVLPGARDAEDAAAP